MQEVSTVGAGITVAAAAAGSGDLAHGAFLGVVSDQILASFSISLSLSLKEAMHILVRVLCFC